MFRSGVCRHRRCASCCHTHTVSLPALSFSFPLSLPLPLPHTYTSPGPSSPAMSATQVQLPVSVLHDVLGTILIGVCMSCFLFGIECTEIARYKSLFPTDRLWIRILVGFMFLVDLASTANLCAMIYLASPFQLEADLYNQFMRSHRIRLYITAIRHFYSFKMRRCRFTRLRLWFCWPVCTAS